MPNLLDDFSKIKELDKSNLLGSVQEFPLQLAQTNRDLSLLKLPADFSLVEKIVVNGMGGSRLGARVIESLFSDLLKVPLIPIGSYDLPSYVDEKTLLILSSYSGDTEEILSTVESAVARKAKILVLSQDGKLGKIAKERKFLGYFNFPATHNPCSQPRMGLGYQISGLMILLSKAGLINLPAKSINDLQVFIEKVKDEYDVDNMLAKNPAKILAKQLNDKIVILIGSEFLVGSLHVFRNQINENSKQLAFYYEIPELNHHLIEGLSFPNSNQSNLVFLFIKSRLLRKENQNRYLITEKLIKKYKFPILDFQLTGRNKIEQAFELVQFGSFVSFYLAILNNLDPTPIPWVDLFKLELEKLRNNYEK